MILNDISNSPAVILKRINKHLRDNYGIKITETTSAIAIEKLVEQLESEISQLKQNGNVSKSSAEISKRLLILEGMKALKESYFVSSELSPVIDALVNYVVRHFNITAVDETAHETFEEAIRLAMHEYRSSKYRYPDDYIESRVRAAAVEKINKSNEEISTNDVEAPISVTESRKGNIMYEQENLIKHLRRLLETEVSQAEVMMAAKGFAQELQEMIEKIGRLQNEDLPPVTDRMRETYGGQPASSFQTQIYSAFQTVMDSLYTAKNQVDDAVANMASTGSFDAEVDMDKDLSIDGGMPTDGEMPDAGAELDDAPELDNIASEFDDVEQADDFGGAESEDPLGRSKKMESATLTRKITEMKKLIEKARRLKEKGRA